MYETQTLGLRRSMRLSTIPQTTSKTTKYINLEENEPNENEPSEKEPTEIEPIENEPIESPVNSPKRSPRSSP